MSVEVASAVPDDAPAIKQLLDEHALASFGEIEMGEDEIRSWFTMPNLWMQLAERDGEVVGYLDIASEESGHLSTSTRGRSMPKSRAARRGRGGARRRVGGDADPARVRPGRRAGAPGGLRGRRLRADPALFQMRIELDGELPEPVWPDGSRAAERLQPGEEERVYEAHMDAFADHWDFRRQPFERLAELSTIDAPLRPVALVARRGRGRAGGDLAQLVALLRRPAVRLDPHARRAAAWRRRGLATALLRHSFRDFRARGATRVGLGVDGENTTGAVRLYERVGMRQVRRNDTYEKTL